MITKIFIKQYTMDILPKINGHYHYPNLGFHGHETARRSVNTFVMDE